MRKTLSRRLVLGSLLMLVLSSNQFNLALEKDTNLEDTNWQLLNMKVLGGFLFTPRDPSQYRLNFRSENRPHWHIRLQYNHRLLFSGEHRLSLRPFRFHTQTLPPGLAS